MHLMKPTTTKTKKPFAAGFFFAAILAVLLLASCKKEVPEQSFNPNGYWRGNAYIIHLGILNRPDGTSRLYFRTFGLDTAGATIGEGTYTMSGNTFKASYTTTGGTEMFIESLSVSDKQITGVFFTSGTPEMVDMKLIKQ